MIAPGLVHERFAVANASGEIMYGDLRYGLQPLGLPRPVVIVCHSFMAFKDWGFFPRLGERIARSGFACVSFNFSRNGVDAHGDRISDFDRFERNTFSHELLDLRTIIDAIRQGEIGSDIVERERLALLGHSRGGGVAIVTAASDDRVRALVTLSAISTFDRWTAHQKERWRAKGYHALARDSTVSPLRLGIDLLEDLESNRDRLSITGAASEIAVPWLIVHGTVDVTVPGREAETLYNASNKSVTELVLLDRVDHLYNAASEADDRFGTLDRIVERVTNWLHRSL